MALCTPTSLVGQHARLVPLSPDHEAGLIEAASDGELWKLWYTAIPAPEKMAAEIARRLDLQAKDSMQPFAVLDASGRVVGMTSFMNIDNVNRRVEIGSTWYAMSAQRGPLNTECKLMLLKHAFEQLDCIAVEFRTHRLNTQSRRAIERLGAQLDGILRSHIRAADGTLRDTAVYSIISTEWPVINKHLQWQLVKPR
ncbi:MAG TPA: GNAT family N-acetyltransferase [Burkholderiaceae bacterium]|jgi:RimJ/RimL family protein N-acetyltransferase